MNIEEYRATEKARIEANKKRMIEDGVIFVDIYTAYIGEEVVIEAGATIANNVTISGKSHIGSGAYIGQSSVIRDSFIGERSSVMTSYVIESRVGTDTNVGPFAYIRPNSSIGNCCKVGDFVEVKNSTMGNGSKSSHLTYIGDADVGEGVNLGCGVVFVNYDGVEKHRSTVGDGAFVGCNSNIIAPVEIGKGAYIAAGTTVTDNVPDEALGIGRSRQENKPGWAVKFRKSKSKK